jgi:type IV pilus assembly protein PilB
MGKEFDLKIGEILVEKKVITEEQLHDALEIQKMNKQRIGRILMDKGFVDEQMIIEALARQFQLPIANISEIEIEKEILEIFSYQMLKKHSVMPIKEDNGYLIVAVNDPLNLSVLQDLRNISGKRIKVVISTLTDIIATLNKYFSPLNSATADAAIQKIKHDVEGFSSKTSYYSETSSLAELEMAAQDEPIVKLVNSIFEEGIKQRVSDIHFEPRKNNLRVRFRVDGILYEKVIIPAELQAAVISRIKIISGMDIAERRKPQDGRMSMADNKLDVRVSTLPDIFGEKIVLRFLYKSGILLSLEELGMVAEELEMIKSLIFRPYGMVLVTGPTGSGKTTTLYSILNILNDESRNIVTVEDPVEYELDGINQTAINVRAKYTFATAIRHILRQDPDIIMIGEIRDLETAEIAIQAALTGHLVLATLHTNSAAGAITRLLDMNVEPFLVSSAVVGVIAQRLVRKLCPVCKKEYSVSGDLKKKIEAMAPGGKDYILAKPGECEECYKRGYKERIGIFEQFPVDDDVRGLILKRANESEIIKLVVSKGMNTLKVSGIKKALARVTSLEEVVRVTSVGGF